MWALGTKNYGMAIRHHLVPYWIIVLLGTPVLAESLNKFFFIVKQKYQKFVS